MATPHSLSPSHSFLFMWKAFIFSCSLAKWFDHLQNLFSKSPNFCCFFDHLAKSRKKSNKEGSKAIAREIKFEFPLHGAVFRIFEWH